MNSLPDCKIFCHRLSRLSAGLLAIALLTHCTPIVETPPPPPPPATILPAPHTIWVAPQETPDEKVIFRTIAAAIKAANGRQIYIAPGTYQESLTIPKDTIVHLHSDPKQPATLVLTDGQIGWNVEANAQLTLRHMIIKGGERGVLLAEGSYFAAEHVTWKDTKGQGIAGQGTEVQLSQCQFTNIQAAPPERTAKIGDPNGILLKQSFLHAHMCTFQEAGSKAILLQDKSSASLLHCQWTNTTTFAISAIAIESGSYANIHKATIKGWKEAIFFNAAEGTVSQSTIEDAKGNALFITQGSLVHLASNTIKRSGRSGISFSISGGSVKDCSIEDALEYGIFAVQGPDKPLLTIEGNQIKHCKGSGIQLFDASLTQVRNNTVTNSIVGVSGDDGHGIGVLDSNQVTVSGNQIKDCVGSGIFFNRSNGEISKNTITGNKESGVLITNAPAEPYLQLTENQLDSNQIAGVFLLGSKATFSKNKIANTVFSTAEQSGSGLVLFGQSQAEISEDTYETNGQHGILIASGSSATIRQSAFVTNKGYGILVQCNTSQLTEEKNVYRDNALGNTNQCP